MELLEILNKPVPVRHTIENEAEFNFVMQKVAELFFDGDRRAMKAKYSCAWCNRHTFYKMLKRKYGIPA